MQILLLFHFIANFIFICFCMSVMIKFFYYFVFDLQFYDCERHCKWINGIMLNFLLIG